ncbi:glycoside hydrolase family 3 N-terminal domain-containing protein [Phycicoccus avicenniae]|uniref:glycoside hydrolase family 3 N-terminal domain-containing protein n=1 Tax=Phycicoccus avicenniae TaxID=2828860 RepID=UPI0020135FC0|nr:glycoside hydrolase family 3 N-terminal domain-containing protein [Phycicoccus avicenniae]
MTARRTPTRSRRAALALTGALAVTLAGCSDGEPSAAPTTSSAPAPSTTSPSPTPTPTCVETTTEALTEDQRLGQLLMVALDTNAPEDSLDDEVTEQHVGNMLFLGGWEGADKVSSASEHLEGLVSEDSTGDVGMLVAADQEGGIVHQLRGSGFTRPPAAVDQATLSPAELTEAATGWAEELAAVGVNVNLAPVVDTVPAELGTGNGPVGQYGREYGNTPEEVERSANAFIEGMLDGGVQATVKHFPGLGRITNNTDFAADGITDDTTTADDPYLEPFASGVEAGANLVMVGSAEYTRIDEGVPAMFSERIVTDVLRGDLGYDGVVITDDVNAESVRSVPPGERAVRVLGAGGDIVLTGDPTQAPEMLDALRAEAGQDEDFAAQVDASVERVLALKDEMGLLPCSQD